MTTAPNLTPFQVKQNKEAHDMGHKAGYQWRMLHEDLRLPRDNWKCLLAVWATNPFNPGEFPDGEYTVEEAARLARRWEQGFEVGDHAGQADIRRGVANRGNA